VRIESNAISVGAPECAILRLPLAQDFEPAPGVRHLGRSGSHPKIFGPNGPWFTALAQSQGLIG